MVYRPGQFLTAADLNVLDERGTWTPVLTGSVSNPNLGAGAIATGTYRRSGNEMSVDWDITFGGAGLTVGSGNYQIEGFPYDIDAIAAAVGGKGTIRITDSSGAAAQMVFPRLHSPTQILMQTTAQPTVLVTNAVPWTWASGDAIRGGFTCFIDV